MSGGESYVRQEGHQAPRRQLAHEEPVHPEGHGLRPREKRCEVVTRRYVRRRVCLLRTCFVVLGGVRGGERGAETKVAQPGNKQRGSFNHATKKHFALLSASSTARRSESQAPRTRTATDPLKKPLASPGREISNPADPNPDVKETPSGPRASSEPLDPGGDKARALWPNLSPVGDRAEHHRFVYLDSAAKTTPG